MSRLTFTDRRRAQLARRVASLDALEERNMITESLGILSMGIGVPTALLALRPLDASAANAHGPKQAIAPPPFATIPGVSRRRPPGAGWLKGDRIPVAATPPLQAAPAGDWLALMRRAHAGASGLAHPGLSAPPAPKKPLSNAGGLSRGGSGGGAAGAITPLRLPPPTPADGGASGQVSTSALGALGSALGSGTPGGVHGTGSGVSSSGGTPTGGGHVTAQSLPAPGVSGGALPKPTIYSVRGNSSPGALGSFMYYPVYVLDYNDGTTLFPGASQLATAGMNVDLRAQARDTTGVTYSWDTTGLGDANAITGAATYRLQFQWNAVIYYANTDTVKLTATDVNGHQEVQTYTFAVPAQSGPSGGGTSTWPESLAPDVVSASDPAFDSHNVSVDSNTGAADAVIPLPAYNPNLEALSLTYDSLLADPRPVVVEHHVLDPAQTTPTKVSGQLTFNGTAGTTWYYNTSQFTPGDIQQIALQADATGLSTGRYAYTVTVGDVRGSTTTTTSSGSVDVLNGAGNAFGAGWTLLGLEHITSASGGLILDLGAGGKSLWFSGAGPYTSPAGDFSTLAAVSGGGYTRTLPDGTVYRFDSSGYETSVADRNGLRTTFTYSSGNLSTVTDPYNKVTTFSYSGGVLSTVTDTASRVTTFTHTGANLTGVTLPDSNSWSYGYDGAHRLTQVTDPRSKTVTVAYDSSERVTTITRPDSTTESITAYQDRGWTNSGTSGSPAAPTLLAEARASHTDPNSHTVDLRPDWNGQGLTDLATDPDGNVATFDRDSNGLATVVIDRLNRVTTYSYYGTKGQVVQVNYPDGHNDQFTYNSFAEPLTHTDSNNHVTSYSYDGSGNLTSVQDPLNNLTTMTYTGDGKVATVKDANSHVTSYQYDSQDRVTTVTNPDGSTDLFAYDSKGNVTSATDERGHATTYSFDALNRVTGMTDALGNPTTYVLDASGNVTAVQAPLSRTTTYAYDSMDRVTTVTDPLSHNTVIGYDPGGNTRTVTDALSRVTTFTYDAEDRVTVVTDPLGHATTSVLDAEGQVISVTDALNRTTTTTYTSRGWVATVTDPLGNVATYTYTATGKPQTESDPSHSGGTLVSFVYDSDDRVTAQSDGLGHTTSVTYDGVGNRTSVTDANNNTTTYVYDSRDRVTTVTDALSHNTVYGYDSGGNQTTVTDALSHITTTQYDALNRATTVTDARGAVTTLVYDAAGRNTVVVDPNGNRTTFGFDAADRVTTVTDPLGHSSTSSYDAANQLTDKTDRNGRRTTYSFDSGGRQTGETWVSASPSETVTYTYDAANQLTGVKDANATLTFAYDSGGRQTSAATSGTAGQPSVTLTFSYDQLGKRTGRTDSLGTAGLTTYAYDAAERLTTLTTKYGGTNGPQVVFGYDAGNRLTSESRTIGGTGTQVNTTLAYDAANRLTTLTHGSDTYVQFPFPQWQHTSLASYVYSYDNANRVATEQYTGTTGSGYNYTVTYTYDNANELTGAGGSRAETYTYDSGGNRTMAGYATGTGNELTNSPGHTYTYDNEGNLLTDVSGGGTTTYTYDYRNRLTAVNVGGTVVATYVYDALDRRVGFKDNGTQTWVVWDGQNPYADFDGSGTLLTRYLYGPAVDQLLTRTSSGGTTAWYLPDRIGSVRDIADASGSQIDHLSYDSIGAVLSESNSGNGDRFKFTGREFDVTTGQYYVRARWYGPVVGRFLSVDPLGFGATDFNLYRYCFNQPTNLSDPSGMAPPPRIPTLIYPVTGGPKSYSYTLSPVDYKRFIEAQNAYILSINKRVDAITNKYRDVEFELNRLKLYQQILAERDPKSSDYRDTTSKVNNRTVYLKLLDDDLNQTVRRGHTAADIYASNSVLLSKSSGPFTVTTIPQYMPPEYPGGSMPAPYTPPVIISFPPSGYTGTGGPPR